MGHGRFQYQTNIGMQFKGLVRFFAIALILISLFQLHFTWVVKNHEGKMESKARSYVNAAYPGATAEAKDAEFKKRLRRLLDSTRETTVTYGTTGAISYQKAKEQELNLGLDLQGGMSVTLEVELEGMLKTLSNNPKSPALTKALATADPGRVEGAGAGTLAALFGQFVGQRGRQDVVQP